MSATTSTFDARPAAAAIGIRPERSGGVLVEIDHPCDHSISPSYEHKLFSNTDPLVAIGWAA
jgi:hypothetical protein